MYRCQNCGEVSKPRQRQHKFTIQTRERTYPIIIDGQRVLSSGKEIVKEASVCEKCKKILEKEVRENG